MKITNCKILRKLNINAIVIYPFVFYCEAKPSEEILEHEQIHLNQIKRDGVFCFYIRYLKEYLRGRLDGLSHYDAYRNISYEKDAFKDL
jgi:hypothetical protein